MRTTFDIVPGGVSGNRLKIESKDLNDARVYQEIKVKRNTTYKITVYVRRRMLRKEQVSTYPPLIAVMFLQKAFMEQTPSGRNFYDLCQNRTKAEESAALSLGLGGYGSESSGVAYFDNVSIEVAKKVPQGERVLNVEPRKPSDDKAGKTTHKKLMQLLFITALASLWFTLLSFVSRVIKNDLQEKKPIL